ncbi:hypothetical protein [Roseivivax sediminis]|uniref:Uncharacterized protein n=1 Tax=Roseivivax sediminis TaxID=936889 RepID=A0A1I1U4S1_9RHOB|nr:hypothetical protein [Roseivivax sediminis]SFD65797.1 hypothetical protein SAMN04515678_102153 [Roseivivax sediminis]
MISRLNILSAAMIAALLSCLLWLQMTDVPVASEGREVMAASAGP